MSGAHARSDRNAERDRETTAMLQEEGWRVLRIWEHTDPAEAVELILAAIEDSAQRRTGSR